MTRRRGVDRVATMRQIRRWHAGMAAVLLLAGCASTSATSTERAPAAPLQTSALLKFADVPVPVGFQLVDNESFAFQNEITRVGLLKYRGRPDVDRVVQFYREQMPLHQWTLLNLLEYESRVLNFEKPDQTCIVTVGRFGDRTQVTIAVAPKGGAARLSGHAGGLKQH